MKTFAERLEFVRLQRGCDQDDLAILVGFEIKPFEENSLLPTTRQALKIANTLQCSLNWLMEGYKVEDGRLVAPSL